jgi:hypothetical protein
MTITDRPDHNGMNVQAVPDACVGPTYVGASGARHGPRWRALIRRACSRRLPRGVATGLAAVAVGVLALAAPAAQASQRPAPRVAATYPYTFSRIAWTGSEEVIAATDNHGALYYFWQAAGTTTWHKQLVASGGYSKPSIAWTGQAVFIATVTAGGYLVSFTKAPSAPTWASTLIAAPASGKYQAPSVTASTDGAIMISAYDAGKLQSFTQAPGGVTWTLNTVAYGTFGPSSIATVYDSLASEYLGLITASSGGTLEFFWEFRGSGAWNQETVASSGTAGSYTGGSVTASNANIVITAATTTGAVDAFTQKIGGSGWTAHTVSASGGPYTSPQAAWTGPVNGGPSYDVITAANSAGTLSYWWVADGSGLAWNPETVAANGTSAVYAHPGIAITSGSVVITAINTKPGNVVYWSQAFATTPWHKEVVATG